MEEKETAVSENTERKEGGIHGDLIEMTNANVKEEGRGPIGDEPGDSNNVVIDVPDNSNETTSCITKGKCLF